MLGLTVADRVSKAVRRRIMTAVGSSNTAPERAVRSLLRVEGWLGYRLNPKRILGRPDIAWIGKKRAIFVHGCFWHGHSCPHGVRAPVANAIYWQEKIARNRLRDSSQRQALRKLGWKVTVIWECELARVSTIKRRIQRLLD